MVAKKTWNHGPSLGPRHQHCRQRSVSSAWKVRTRLGFRVEGLGSKVLGFRV